MKTFSPSAFAVALCACGSAVAAGEAGYVKHDGRTVAVTAVYAHTEANSEVIVFSDRERATRQVEKQSQGGYTTTDDGVSADAIFRDLAARGGHPVELTISPPAADGSRSAQLAILEGKGRPVTRLSPFKIDVQIARQDDEHVEGVASYDDGRFSMKLPFALDKNRVGRANASAGEMPPPPPPPAPTFTSPNTVLRIGTDLLVAQIDDYYAKHHAWPATRAQALGAYASGEPPPNVASQDVGPGGTVTVVFKPDAPFLAGKTVTLTPTPGADGRLDWQCAGSALPPDTCP